MTADPRIAAAVVADRPLLGLAVLLAAVAFLAVFGKPLSRRVRRRNWVRAARHHWRAHPSIEQASHDRPEVVPPPLTDTGRAQCSHGVLLSEGPCPLCAAMPKGPPHCGYWCENTPAGRCRYWCVELMGES